MKDVVNQCLEFGGGGGLLGGRSVVHEEAGVHTILGFVLKKPVGQLIRGQGFKRHGLLNERTVVIRCAQNQQQRPQTQVFLFLCDMLKHPRHNNNLNVHAMI